MNSNTLLRLAPVEQPRLGLFIAPSPTPSPVPRPAVVDREVESPVRVAVVRLRQALLAEQQPDGSWQVGQPALPAMLAKRLLLRLFCTRDVLSQAPTYENESLIEQIVSQQRPTGGWATTSDATGAADLSASILCYLAIKLCEGVDALPRLKAARETILALGGINAADKETRAWLALFGQVDSESQVDKQLPEVVAALKTLCPVALPPLSGVSELFRTVECAAPENKSQAPERVTDESARLWAHLAKRAANADPTPAERKVLDEELAELTSPNARSSGKEQVIVNTARAVRALLESGMRQEDEPIAAAMDWLLDNVDSAPRDSETAPANLGTITSWLAASDSTAGELPPRLTIRREHSACPRIIAHEAREQRLIELGRQLAGELAAHIDLNEDEPSPLESKQHSALVQWTAGGVQAEHQAKLTQQLTEKLLELQQRDGSWPAAADIDARVATAQAMLTLQRAGLEPDAAPLLAGVNWLLAEQNADGGWGDEPGELNVRATSQAVEALSAAGFASHAAVDRAIDHLLDAEASLTDRLSEEAFRSETRFAEQDLLDSVRLLGGLSRWSVDSPANPQRRRGTSLRLVGSDRF